MNAVIVCNGQVRDYSYYKKYFDAANLIICADGGAAHIRRLRISPHILLGDFDSISESDLAFFKETGVKILKYPPEKDFTDTEIAVDLAIEKGCRTIYIIGGLGTRLDHSLANILMLKKMLDRGVRGIIADEYNEITLIKDKIHLVKEENVKVSLLPLTQVVEGVTTKGLYYPLENAVLHMGASQGVSNEFAGDTAEISIRGGLLLVVRARD